MLSRIAGGSSDKAREASSLLQAFYLLDIFRQHHGKRRAFGFGRGHFNAAFVGVHHFLDDK